MGLLKDSPSLELLGLTHVNKSLYAEFLKDICGHYASIPGTKPLSLKTLKLGYGMCLRCFQMTGNYLKALLQLDKLETLHVHNRNLSTEWTFFEECHSVHQLAVYVVTKEVCDWLNKHPSTCELLVTFHFDIYNEYLDYFDLLRLPRLSMLYVREMFVDISDDIPTDRDMTLDLIRKRITVLDRLHDEGIHLTRLALCLDPRHQWVSIVHRIFLIHKLILSGTICASLTKAKVTHSSPDRYPKT